MFGSFWESISDLLLHPPTDSHPTFDYDVRMAALAVVWRESTFGAEQLREWQQQDPIIALWLLNGVGWWFECPPPVVTCHSERYAEDAQSEYILMCASACWFIRFSGHWTLFFGELHPETKRIHSIHHLRILKEELRLRFINLMIGRMLTEQNLS